MIMSNSTYNQLTANQELLKLTQMKLHLDEIRDFVTTNVLSFTEGLLKHLYNAKVAQKTYETTRSESRQGIAITPEELKRVDAIVSPLVKLGQSVHMICVNNADDIMLDEKTIYNYIDAGLFICR